MTVLQTMLIGSAPPTSSWIPSAVTAPPVTGLFSTSDAPWFSASPKYASIKPWLSIMPVDGERKPAKLTTAGSSSANSSRDSMRRSSTPLISA